MRNTPFSALYYRLAVIALLLSLGVVMLGAYTRLSDAGLGCPDWPGCYGKMVLPQSQPALTQAQKAFPNLPIVPKKAWKEMIHRYFAGTLGTLIMVLVVLALVRKVRYAEQPLFVPLLLLGMMIFQAVLGMWTVTWKVLPLVVMSHMLGGVTIAALLCWLVLSLRLNPHQNNHLASLRPWAILAIILVMAQIFLGAWTSTNYSALVCPTFPFCHGTLFPNMEWKSAFDLISPVGPNYEGGRLALDTRVTIQMAHRYGALITGLYLLPLSFALIFVRRFAALRTIGLTILALFCLQFLLGVMNVVWTLPMWNAVMHNGVAALLLLSVVTLTYRLFGKSRMAYSRIV
jgi:cytochrome c oxidase assembly protein subunit 15